jgi:hypothetical protein
VSYFKTRIKELDMEYSGRDREHLIREAGKCAICDRTAGEQFVFGPTHYLKQKIRFKVGLDVHVIDGATMSQNKVVLCDGCHMGYHLFNRLDEEAELGKKLKDTLYARCKKCRELVSQMPPYCRCCEDCSRAPDRCLCEWKKMSCTSHPRYKVIRRPTSGCRTCLKIWASKIKPKRRKNVAKKVKKTAKKSPSKKKKAGKKKGKKR